MRERPTTLHRQPSTRPGNHRPPMAYRLVGDPRDRATGPLAREPNVALVEAALVAADEPLTVRKLAQAAGLTDATEVRKLIARLRALYDQDGTAFQVEEVAGGYQLLTRPAYHPWLARLRRSVADLKLSPAARETLAVVAYRQPITRADVEAIRGVQCGEVVRQLMEKGLVRIAGRDTSLGRPVLYGTTKKFLQWLGLRSLKELPMAAELTPPRPRPVSPEPPAADESPSAES